MDTITISHSPKPITCTRSSSSPPTLIFTHGAGGTLSSPGIADFAAGYGALAPIACFQGSMNLASRVKAFSTVLSSLGPCSTLGGRSMGARAAVLAYSNAHAATDSDGDADADANDDGAGTSPPSPETKPLALVLASYPLKGPKDTRDAILLALPAFTRVLFITGDRDAMCPALALDGVRAHMACRTWAVVVRGADHGMSVVPSAGTHAVGQRAGRVAAEWVAAVARGEADEARTAGALWWDAEGRQAVWTGWQHPEELERDDAGVTDSRGAKEADADTDAGAPEPRAAIKESRQKTKAKTGARQARSKATTPRPAGGAGAPVARVTAGDRRKTKAKRDYDARNEAPPPVRRSKRLKAQ